MAEQRRHWLSTIWPKHLGAENDEQFGVLVCELWKQLDQDTRLKYACGQFERGEEGGLHVQVYTEWNTSLRRSQVLKVLPSHSEARQGTRSQARDYCRKSEGREGALPDLGEWRAERGDDTFGASLGPKARALELITKQGLTPMEISVEDPEAYFTFSTAIHRLYEMLKVAGALPQRSEVLPKSLPPVTSTCEEE